MHIRAVWLRLENRRWTQRAFKKPTASAEHGASQYRIRGYITLCVKRLLEKWPGALTNASGSLLYVDRVIVKVVKEMGTILMEARRKRVEREKDGV